MTDKEKIVRWIKDDIKESDIDDLYYIFNKYPEMINHPLDDTGNPFVLYVWEIGNIELAFYAVQNWTPDLTIENKNGLTAIQALTPSIEEENERKRLQKIFTTVNLAIVTDEIIKQVEKTENQTVPHTTNRI